MWQTHTHTYSDVIFLNFSFYFFLSFYNCVMQHVALESSVELVDERLSKALPRLHIIHMYVPQGFAAMKSMQKNVPAVAFGFCESG